MTIEDKAKRYDELLLKLQKAKVDDNVCDEMYYRVIDDIVPELKESEDEKIRKAIRIYFDWLDGRKDYAPRGEYTIRDMIAWIEKQHIQKQEISYPKFDFDDILALQCCMETAEKVTEDKELYKKLQSLHSRLHDAYWLEKQGEEKQDPCEHCDDKRLNCHNFPCIKKRVFEQGKSVFDIINEENVDNANKVEQKPAWSEEDKVMLDDIIDFFENGTVKLQHDLSLYASWLKSLKERYTWKPSDEQMKAFENFVRGIWESCYDSPYENNAKLLYSLLEQLKKLK